MQLLVFLVPLDTPFWLGFRDGKHRRQQTLTIQSRGANRRTSGGLRYSSLVLAPALIYQLLTSRGPLGNHSACGSNYMDGSLYVDAPRIRRLASGRG
jgi:hypothetical protein